MKVVILAGGIGKRFWPITRSKVLTHYLGKPVIEYTLSSIVWAGFNDIVIVTNTADKDEINKIKFPGVKISSVIQPEPKGMADAILTAQQAIGVSPILVINAHDIVENGLYKEIASKISEGKPLLVGRKTDMYFEGGYYKLQGDSVVGVVEKPGPGNQPSNLLNLVFDYFPDSAKLFDLVKNTQSEEDDVYEKALDSFISQNDIRPLIYSGYWQPLKYPWHILNLMEYFLRTYGKEYRGKNVEIRSNVTIDGRVFIGNNVKIFENTKIVGPCYIGENTIIGNNNIIRASQIGENCVTGFNTDITRSYIGDNCWFHSNYIGDGVIEGNVSLGSGTVLANLRLDEGDIFSVVKGEPINTMRNKLGAVIARDVRVGVNTSVMPGVKIGRNSFIGAGLVISQDVPDNSFCVGKTILEIQKNTKKITSLRKELRKNI